MPELTDAVPDPTPRFDSEEAAIDWLEREVDDPCTDNYRIGYYDGPASMVEYDRACRDGCCGSADYEAVIAGRRATIGCNFGH